MKTVILTSSGWLFPQVRKEIIAQLPTVRPLRVLYIPTASKVVLNKEYARRDVAIMHDLGYEVLALDISSCNRDDLQRAIKRSHAVYVQGGNGFYLLKCARESGFMEMIKEPVEKGRLLYIGKSAGSYLACPNMTMHTWHAKEWNRYGQDDLTALGLVDFLVQAHYSLEDNESIKSGMKQADYPLKLITNQQLVVIKGKKSTISGDRPVYEFNNGEIREVK